MRALRRIVTLITVASINPAKANSNEDLVARRTDELHSSSSNVDWTLNSSGPKILSTSEIFLLETIASDFFHSNEDIRSRFSDQSILITNVDVIDQSIDETIFQIHLKSQLTFLYAGKVVNDFPTILSRAMEGNSGKILNIMQENGLLVNSTIDSLSFSPGTSTLITTGRTQKKQDNVLISLIAVIFTLLVLVVVLLCRTRINSSCDRGDDETHKAQQVVKESNTEESDDATQTPGILGAGTNEEAYDQIMTPQRGIYNEFDAETPLSVMTNETNVSSASSIKSHNPLGIVSMNRLNKCMFTPEKLQKEKNSLYNVAIED